MRLIELCMRYLYMHRNQINLFPLSLPPPLYSFALSTFYLSFPPPLSLSLYFFSFFLLLFFISSFLLPLFLQACIERNCYPSPLNYCNFPKSCCTWVSLYNEKYYCSLHSFFSSVNEVICHGIPDTRELVDGDICNGVVLKKFYHSCPSFVFLYLPLPLSVSLFVSFSLSFPFSPYLFFPSLSWYNCLSWWLSRRPERNHVRRKTKWKGTKTSGDSIWVHDEGNRHWWVSLSLPLPLSHFIFL